MANKLEDMDFHPLFPLGRLLVTLCVGGVFAFAIITETHARLEFAALTDLRFLAETIVMGTLWLLFIGSVPSFLLLQFRLKFTEAGLQRRTLLKPHFIPWHEVQRAQVAHGPRGYFALELWISPRRWVCVPLLEYKHSASLFAEIRRRLAVEVSVSAQALALLRKDD